MFDPGAVTVSRQEPVDLACTLTFFTAHTRLDFAVHFSGCPCVVLVGSVTRLPRFILAGISRTDCSILTAGVGVGGDGEGLGDTMGVGARLCVGVGDAGGVGDVVTGGVAVGVVD